MVWDSLSSVSRLSTPRIDAKDKMNNLLSYDPGAPLPFDTKLLTSVVNTLKFHKVCLHNLVGGSLELGQISRISGPDGLTSFYSETYAYRKRSHKMCITYAPKTMSSSVFVHNLSIDDTRDLVYRLSKPSVQPLTIHPMLIPVLVYEFTFHSCHEELYSIWNSCIGLDQGLGLNTHTAFSHFRKREVDDKEATKKAVGHSHWLCALEERVDFSITIGKKLMSYFDDLEQKTPDSEIKTTFVEAASIIRNRLEYSLRIAPQPRATASSTRLQ
jgi:ribosomal protein S30